jgi:hypothetical protein
MNFSGPRYDYGGEEVARRKPVDSQVKDYRFVKFI